MISESQRERLTALMETPELAAAQTRYTLRVGPVDYTNRVRGLSRPAADGPAVVLNVTVAGNVPLEIQDEAVVLTVRIGSGSEAIEYLAFKGRLLEPSPDDIDSDLKAATGGYWLAELKFTEETQYPGFWPSTALRDILRRCPYDRVALPEVREPLIVASDDPDTVFNTSYDFPTELAEAVGNIEEEAEVTVWDRPENVGSAVLQKSLESPGEIAAEWVVGRHIRKGEFRYSGAFESSYSAVWVWRTEEARPVVMQKVPIRNSNAPADAILDVEITDQSPEAYENAYRKAYRLASQASYSEWKLTELTTVMIDPRAERGSTVAISEDIRTYERAKVRRRWLVLLKADEPDYFSRSCSYGEGLLKLVSEEVLEVPPPLPEVATGEVAKRLYGVEPGGLLYAPEEWVYVTEDGDLEAYVDAPIEQDQQTKEYSFAVV